MPRFIHPQVISVDGFIRESLEDVDFPVESGIERPARTCYKSEVKIGPGTAQKMIERLIKRKHFPMIEFGYAAAHYVCNRGLTHELVRHRVSSFAQECLVGGTRVHWEHTIKDLYDKQESDLRELRIKSMDRDGSLVDNRIRKVFRKGRAKVFRVRTQFGHLLTGATENHVVFTPSGEALLLDLSPGSKVLVAGESPRMWPGLGSMCVAEDTVVDIEEMGEEEVYDMEVDGPHHNYVADGFIVHNSTRYVDYTKSRHGGEVTFIIPPEIEKDPEALRMWKDAMTHAEETYRCLRGKGQPAEIARGVLPIDVKTEIHISANLREWRHIFSMRCADTAHPHIRKLMKETLARLSKKAPTVFADQVKEFLNG